MEVSKSIQLPHETKIGFTSFLVLNAAPYISPLT